MHKKIKKYQKSNIKNKILSCMHEKTMLILLFFFYLSIKTACDLVRCLKILKSCQLTFDNIHMNVWPYLFDAAVMRCLLVVIHDLLLKKKKKSKLN